MARKPPAMLTSLGSALLLVAVGCDSYPDAPPLTTSMEEATLKGVVRVNGKPVDNGTISFRTAHIRRPNSPTKHVDIGKDGSYSVKTVIGENYVEVETKELTKPAMRRYRNQEQLIMVQSGDSTVDISIPATK
jgi:hypothetical protein